MKKITLSLIAAAALCQSHFLLAAGTVKTEPNWTGFYVGANAGYWISQNNTISTTGTSSYVNQTYPLGASNIANALATVGSNDFSLNPHGLIGGGQAGYNYQYNKWLLFGIDVDFDGLTNSNNTYNLQKTVNLVDFDESYSGSLSFKQKINYLGTVRARLGYLCQPTVLLYATGGFAYGNVTLDSTWSAQESLGSAVFPTVTAQNNVSKTLTGWTAGAGVEWLFKPNWIARFEYTYYYLNHLDAPVTLAQTNASISPAALWASASAKTTLSTAIGTFRVGINYRFT